ncbi:hypothetical protein K431DRAFT_292184 [Polychaeton citri CBS 116435]|uniref:Uncharacterized protein n=1 Tax=Polychaeton citri CBS 116435 TaxID=1314669 RepID=A0A9P4USQ1_9PEZI|nr:hypothetical protein K431DRAFT_292184 [Polychaeton citri CBS 116435]
MRCSDRARPCLETVSQSYRVTVHDGILQSVTYVDLATLFTVLPMSVPTFFTVCSVRHVVGPVLKFVSARAAIAQKPAEHLTSLTNKNVYMTEAATNTEGEEASPRVQAPGATVPWSSNDRDVTTLTPSQSANLFVLRQGGMSYKDIVPRLTVLRTRLGCRLRYFSLNRDMSQGRPLEPELAAALVDATAAANAAATARARQATTNVRRARSRPQRPVRRSKRIGHKLNAVDVTADRAAASSASTNIAQTSRKRQRINNKDQRNPDGDVTKGQAQFVDRARHRL